MTLKLDHTSTKKTGLNLVFTPIKLGDLVVGNRESRYSGGWYCKYTYRPLSVQTDLRFDTLEELADWISENPTYLDDCKQPGE